MSDQRLVAVWPPHSEAAIIECVLAAGEASDRMRPERLAVEAAERQLLADWRTQTGDQP